MPAHFPTQMSGAGSLNREDETCLMCCACTDAATPTQFLILVAEFCDCGTSVLHVSIQWLICTWQCVRMTLATPLVISYLFAPPNHVHAVDGLNHRLGG